MRGGLEEIRGSSINARCVSGFRSRCLLLYRYESTIAEVLATCENLVPHYIYDTVMLSGISLLCVLRATFFRQLEYGSSLYISYCNAIGYFTAVCTVRNVFPTARFLFY